MASSLPPHADFDHLRGQARALQRAHARGDTEARRRVDEVPELRSLGGPLTLAAAHLAIARGYGFPSWAKLKHHLERRDEDAPQRAAAFVAAACGGDASQARQILAEWPEVATIDLHAACAAGDVATVRRLIAQRPELAAAEGGPKRWPPLLSLCLSSLFSGGGRSADAMAIARELLDRGAKANCFHDMNGDPDYRETPLSAACNVHGDAALMRVLLESGAQPIDENAYYYAVGAQNLEALRALVDHGLPPAQQRLHHQLDSEHPAVLRWLLEHGVDPNRHNPPQESALHWAIKRGRSREVIALLIDHGADLEARIARGHTQFPTVVASTPLELAIRCLHRDAIELLIAKGARTEALPVLDQALLACARADREAAERVLVKEPDALRAHPELTRNAVVAAAASGNAAGLELLLANGGQLGGKGWMEGGPLHQAALNGEADAVAVLLRHGASVDDRENNHRTTPLSWAEYGSQAAMNPNGRYPEIAELLIAAGSPLPEHLRGSDGVREVLRRHGVGA